MNKQATNKYDDERKQTAWESYWEGYKLGYHVQDYDSMDLATANTNFEEWWSVTHGL